MKMKYLSVSAVSINRLVNSKYFHSEELAVRYIHWCKTRRPFSWRPVGCMSRYRCTRNKWTRLNRSAGSLENSFEQFVTWEPPWTERPIDIMENITLMFHGFQMRIQDFAREVNVSKIADVVKWSRSIWIKWTIFGQETLGLWCSSMDSPTL